MVWTASEQLDSNLMTVSLRLCSHWSSKSFLLSVNSKTAALCHIHFVRTETKHTKTESELHWNHNENFRKVCCFYFMFLWVYRIQHVCLQCERSWRVCWHAAQPAGHFHCRGKKLISWSTACTHTHTDKGRALKTQWWKWRWGGECLELWLNPDTWLAAQVV